MSDQTRTGDCLCGWVRFMARGEPINVRICHCRLCQKAMGSPFFARALYDAAQVNFSAEPASFLSSPDLARLFCPRCGTRVGASRASAGRIALSIALFENPDAFAPECHFFVESRLAWVELGDGLPQYPQWPPT